jgi:hypothetical protein
MILRRYTNANGDQQEICLSQEDWEKVTEESLEMMLGFKKADDIDVPLKNEVTFFPATVTVEPVAEEAPVAVKAPAKKRK